LLQLRSDNSKLNLHHNLTQHNTQSKPREYLHAFERADKDQAGELEDAKDHVKCASLSYPENEL
jgi:hypothetical protein